MNNLNNLYPERNYQDLKRLVPNLDRAFDRSYITFDSSGKILISNKLNSASGFGINKNLCIPPDKLNQNHIKYLAYHRDNIFISESN